MSSITRVNSSSGNYINELVKALVESGSEKAANVRQTIGDSLVIVGKSHPDLVLSIICGRLTASPKISEAHRIILLNSIERIISDTEIVVNNALVVSIVKECVAEIITTQKEGCSEWQLVASNVLVSITSKYCSEIVPELFVKFVPGSVPCYLLIDTMARMTQCDAFRMVPFLNEILARILPLLTEAKQEIMRVVLAGALEKFCDAISEYIANIDRAPDKSINKSLFTNNVQIAFDVLNSQWLSSKEMKVKVAVIVSLCHMVPMLSVERLYEQLGHLVTSVLPLYKKLSDVVALTQGLSLLIETITGVNSARLEVHLDDILTTLFAQVCQHHETSNAVAVKNNAEFLRCFLVIEKSFIDKVCSFLLHQLELPNEKPRIGSLVVLRFTVSNGGTHMAGKKSLILSGLRIVLADNNPKVKSYTLKVISAMAHQDYLVLEGGEIMIEYMIKQCIRPPTSSSSSDASGATDPISQMSTNMLQLLTVTVDSMEDALWPYILEFILPLAYTSCLRCICQCMTSVLERMSAKDPNRILATFSKNINLPKLSAVLARLFVVSGLPQHDNRGTAPLLALKALAPLFDPNVSTMLIDVIPKLLKYVEYATEGDEENINASESKSKWQDILLKFLSKVLDCVDNTDWPVEIGEAMGQQIALYNAMPEEKSFLFKCLGVVLRKATKKELVSQQLDNMFKSVKHNNFVEVEGLATSCGYAASSHLDIVLSKLDSVLKADSSKPSGSFFGFLKDLGNKDEPEGKLRAAVVLCYGLASICAPTSLISSRIEGCVVQVVLPCFVALKNAPLKYSVLQATTYIAKTMHKEHLGVSHAFSQRNDLLQKVLELMKHEVAAGSAISNLRPLMLQACSSLVILEPVLTPAQFVDVVSTACSFTIVLPESDQSWKTEFEYAKSKNLAIQATSAMENMFISMLQLNCTEEMLDMVLQELHPWTVRPAAIERERASWIAFQLASAFQKSGVPLASCSGKIIGRLVGRCTDSQQSVRAVCTDTIRTLLIAMQGNASSEFYAKFDNILALQNSAAEPDAATLFAIASELAKGIAVSLLPEQLQAFLLQVMNGLTDSHAQSSSGCCVILNTVLKSRGAAFDRKFVEELLGLLLAKLPEVTNQQAYAGALRLVRTSALHHLQIVVAFLLSQPTPFSKDLTEAWRTLGQDAHLGGHVIDRLLALYSENVPFDEIQTKGAKLEHQATLLPISITFAFAELLRVEEAAACILKDYPRILCSLLIRIAQSVDVKAPKNTPKSQESVMLPLTSSVDAFRQLFTILAYSELLQDMDEAFKLLESGKTAERAYTIIASGIAKYQAEHLAQIVQILSTSCVNSAYDCQRILMASIFAEFVSQKCGGNGHLLEAVVSFLLGRLIDPCLTVRQLCIRGLSNLANVGPGEVRRYITTVITALMDGMNDKDDFEDSVMLESMNGFRCVFNEIDERDVRNIIINVCLRIRSCFEKDNSSIRQAAFGLFGALAAKFAEEASRDKLAKQVHANLVPLLLHLNDSDAGVRDECKQVLRKIHHLIGSEKLSALFESCLPSTESLHYGEFISQTSKLLVLDFADELNTFILDSVAYFKSPFAQLRGNAVMLVGFLLLNLPSAKNQAVPKQQICNSLIALLKDEDENVRIKTAEAISNLRNF